METCPSNNEWIMEYDSVANRNEISFSVEWLKMELEKIILNDVTRPRKKDHAFSFSLKFPSSKYSDVSTETRKLKQDHCKDRGVAMWSNPKENNKEILYNLGDG